MHGMEYFKIFITMLRYTFSEMMFDDPSDYGRNHAFYFFQYDSAQDRIANNSRCCLESVPCDKIISRGSCLLDQETSIRAHCIC